MMTGGDMPGWFEREIVDTGRLPLFCFFVAMIGAFGFIRLSVRMIRAKVRWWPGNVKPGGLHIHHVVFGVVMMIIGGVAGLTLPDDYFTWTSLSAAVFGIGTALVLDEFALILHLKDVYWETEGRTSVDALFVAVAGTGLLLLGFSPLQPLLVIEDDDARWVARTAYVGLVLLNLALGVLTLLKGKIWTGLVGLFVTPLLMVGAVRLARPGSPWAHWRYVPGTRKMTRAIRREAKLRQPMIAAKIWFQEFIAGRHDRHIRGE